MAKTVYFLGLALLTALLVSCGEAKEKSRSADVLVNLKSVAEYDVNWAKIGGNTDLTDCDLRPGQLGVNTELKGFIEFKYRDCSSSEYKYTTVFSDSQIPNPFQVNFESASDREWVFVTGLTSTKNNVDKRIKQKAYFEALRFLTGVTPEQAEDYFNSLPSHCYSQVLPNNPSADKNISDWNMKVWQVFNHNRKKYPEKPENASEIQLSEWSDEVAAIDKYNYSCKESAVYIHQNEFLFYIDRKGVVSIPSIKLYTYVDESSSRH